MKQVKQIHAHLVQTGLDQDLYLAGKIIVFCAASECGSMDYAVSVFENMESPDGFIWNTMIRGFGRTNQVEKVFGYYKKMQEKDLVTDNFTLSFLLKVCGQVGSVCLGKQLHCCTLKHGLEIHVFVRNTLVHMYGMLRDNETARQLFEEITEPDLVAWNTIIDCHVHCGKYRQALELFSRMLRSGIEPDEATLVVTIAACSASGAFEFGRWVHSFVSQSPLVDTVSVTRHLLDLERDNSSDYILLANMYASAGQWDDVARVRKSMTDRGVQKPKPGNSLIGGQVSPRSGRQPRF
ncbi:hypothetical protein Acr_26g0008470 [Actinidia rufa]|uniref:Tetratricopeptide repeat (TPR)-like superfamily protein n=1 Tax=Actinidia rufa TaxID=165716 RepID=A0A7J0H3A7_9ERIC|nr:hypothetical protein Acr_26g0008470 [Actinidia rufa]